MLQVENLSVRYGAIRAVAGISFEISQGQITALIGPNGAGKTSTLKAIAGLLPFEGQILLEGRPLRPGRAEERPGQGLSLVPEGRGILVRMTVQENLQLGGYSRRGGAPAAELDAIYARFPILAERRAVPAGLLSGGEQQMLAIGRALLARPRLLLLDEPSLGLAPRMVDQILQIVSALRREGMTILLVEQKARQSLAIADQACILETGRIVSHNTAAALLSDRSLAEAYLGTGAAD